MPRVRVTRTLARVGYPGGQATAGRGFDSRGELR